MKKFIYELNFKKRKEKNYKNKLPLPSWPMYIIPKVKPRQENKIKSKKQIFF